MWPSGIESFLKSLKFSNLPFNLLDSSSAIQCLSVTGVGLFQLGLESHRNGDPLITSLPRIQKADLGVSLVAESLLDKYPFIYTRYFEPIQPIVTAKSVQGWEPMGR